MKKIILAITILSVLINTFAFSPAYAASEDIVSEFESETADFVSGDTSKVQVGVYSGALKTVVLSNSDSAYIYKTLSRIEGAVYNRVKIRAKVESASGLTSASDYGFGLYFEGLTKGYSTLKIDETRTLFVPYTNLANSGSSYSNSVYQEYVVDLAELPRWSECKISKFYIKPLKNATGTVHIDSVRLYHDDKPVGSIGQTEFNGDVTFFDNRYCHLASTPYYNTSRIRFSDDTDNFVKARLINYQSPDRQDYIYMKRANGDSARYFNVYTPMPSFAHASDFKHKYYKMEGDFKADTLQRITFMSRDNETVSGTDYDTTFDIYSDGSLETSDKTINNVVKAKEWFHLLWFINLETGTYDLYIDEEKIISDEALTSGTNDVSMIRVSLSYENIGGDLYTDNFNVTGLIKPIVDGVETKTSVIADDSQIISYLSDKTAMHTYGHTLFKNGEKTTLTTKGIYDKKTQQYYVTSDVLAKTFDLSLSDSGESIAGDVNITKSGVATTKSGKSVTFEYAPKTANGRLYVPVRQFASDIAGKNVWWFKTGILMFSDSPIALDGSDWEYQSARVRAGGATLWNDIDYLNAYLQYIRPDSKKLKEDYIKTTGDTTFTTHPRIYKTAQEFAEMKAQYESGEDKVFENNIQAYINYASSDVANQSFVTYSFTDSMRSNIGSEFISKFVRWGTAYNITGDQKYVDHAYKQFQMIESFPDFNTGHIIDAGHALRGVAVGYDWFYNGFTPEQREYVLSVIHKHFPTVADALYGRVTSTSSGSTEWRAVKLNTNYNTILNSGITLCALATLEYNPDSMFTYIADSTRSMEYTMQMLAPGGAWTEGPSYLNLVMQSLVPWASNMEKNFGQSYNIMDGQGVVDVLDFMISSIGIDGINNSGDCAMQSTNSQESFFYLAKRYGRPEASYLRWKDVSTGFFDTFYYDFDAKNIDESILDSVPKMQYIDGMEQFSIRDTYTDTNNGTYFSAHFGTAIGNHQHWDCGTFVLDLLGQRWAYDLGTENYNLQNEQGYEGYEIFRKRAEAHNMLVINPTKYTDRVEIEAENGEFAPVIDADSNEYGGYVYADMSQIYEDASKMLLGYYIDDNMSSVTMRNEFTLDTDSSLAWTMNTKGKVTIDGNIAYVARAGKVIKLEVLCSGTNVKWLNNGPPKPYPETIPAEKFAKQYQNEGYSQLRLTFDAAAGEHRLAVKIGSAHGNIKPIDDTPISLWTLPEKEDVSFAETFKGVLVKTTYDNSAIAVAGYDKDNNLVNVGYNETDGNNTMFLKGYFDKVRVFNLDSIESLKPLSKPVEFKNTLLAKSDTFEKVLFDFNTDLGGIVSKNPSLVKLSCENGALKYEALTEADCSMHIPLDYIDGEYYNRLRIKAKFGPVISSNDKCNQFRIYYTGYDDETGEMYDELSTRGKTSYYRNVVKNDDGTYSGEDYEEYIIDLSTISMWSKSYISRVRFDGIRYGTGVLYIDEIEFYHED